MVITSVDDPFPRHIYSKMDSLYFCCYILSPLCCYLHTVEVCLDSSHLSI